MFIPSSDIDQYPADQIVVLSTGAQGEEFAALMRMSTDKHKFITLNERDTIVLSSSVIPGNEIAPGHPRKHRLVPEWYIYPAARDEGAAASNE